MQPMFRIFVSILSFCCFYNQAARSAETFTNIMLKKKKKKTKHTMWTNKKTSKKHIKKKKKNISLTGRKCASQGRNSEISTRSPGTVFRLFTSSSYWGTKIMMCSKMVRKKKAVWTFDRVDFGSHFLSQLIHWPAAFTALCTSAL